MAAALLAWADVFGPPTPPVQLAPLVVERKCPSSVTTSMMPPSWTTTSHTLLAGLPTVGTPLGRVGSMKVHVAPESVLRARPQFVPIQTLLGVAGSTEIPCADG